MEGTQSNLVNHTQIVRLKGQVSFIWMNWQAQGCELQIHRTRANVT